MSDWYDRTGSPLTLTSGSSAIIRNEYELIETAMAKLPILTGSPSQLVFVNAAGTALESVSSLPVDLDFGGFNGINSADAVNPADLTTLSQVNALILGGGSPGSIAITSLNVGTATAEQGIRVNEAGTAIEGFDEIAEMQAAALSFF